MLGALFVAGPHDGVKSVTSQTENCEKRRRKKKSWEIDNTRYGIRHVLAVPKHVKTLDLRVSTYERQLSGVRIGPARFPVGSYGLCQLAFSLCAFYFEN